MKEKVCFDFDMVMEVIDSLRRSQGFYCRLWDSICTLQQEDPEAFEKFVDFVEKQELRSTVDVVMFFEC